MLVGIDVRGQQKINFFTREHIIMDYDQKQLFKVKLPQ